MNEKLNVVLFQFQGETETDYLCSDCMRGEYTHTTVEERPDFTFIVNHFQ